MALWTNWCFETPLDDYNVGNLVHFHKNIQVSLQVLSQKIFNLPIQKGKSTKTFSVS